MSAFTTTSAVGLVSDRAVWVEADTKETDLTYVKNGNPVSFTIDKTPPVITVTGVINGALTNATVTPVVTVSDAHPGTQMIIILNGQPFSSGTAVSAEGSYTLVVRSSMLETLGDDYVLTARAKGLPVRRIVWRHAVRNALLPMVTLIALELGFIVGGALLVEVIFSWPGIGLAMYTAIGQRDYPMLQGGFLILTVSVIVLNFLADLLYFRLDPRITT